ncbi:unnamed protein product [Calypogeia fissa]
MEVAGVTAQWRAVAAPAMMRSAESLIRGKALRPRSKVGARRGGQMTNEAGGLLVLAGKKKVNAYDDGWSKQWFGAGLFAESSEAEDGNIIKKLEKKKLLSQVEKAGILSKAESVGLSLSQIEKMGLLSKAEELGLLSLAENFATSSPAVIASFSIPLFVASILTIILIPDTDPTLVIAQNILAFLFLGGAGALFIGSIILSGLQEE